MGVHVRDHETEIVDRLRRRFASRAPGIVVGIGDDTAVIRRDVSSYWLMTADMLVESVHFDKKERLSLVGYKALAVSVSDIAAMGGIPKYALLSVGLPRRRPARAARELTKGLARAARAFGVSVIGGDTVRSPSLVLDVTVLGVVERRRLVRRHGARDGDVLFVSGPLGGSRGGRHLSFVPRLKPARYLTRHFLVRSMMDISDGLVRDLGRMARASGLGAVLDEKDIPVHPSGRGLASALYDGEDFELLFSLAPRDAASLMRRVELKKTPVRFYPVGRMDRSFRGVWLNGVKGRRRLRPSGFSHF